MNVLSLTDVQLVFAVLISWLFAYCVGAFFPFVRMENWMAKFNWILFLLLSVGSLVLLVLGTSLWIGGGALIVSACFVYFGRKGSKNFPWHLHEDDEN